MADAFDQIEFDSAKRIADATRWVERRIQNEQGHRGLGHGDQWEHWYVLQEDLDAGGTATASRLIWTRTGDGSYSDSAPSTTYTLTDAVQQHWGVTGEYIRARVIGAENDPVHEVLCSGAPWHRGLIFDEVDRDESVSVSLVIHGEPRTVTACNVFSPVGDPLVPGSGGMRVGISYNVHHLADESDGSGSDVFEPRWEITEAECE